jgi:hypothetical protein
MKENIPKVWERNFKNLLGSGYFILFKVRKKLFEQSELKEPL